MQKEQNYKLCIRSEAFPINRSISDVHPNECKDLSDHTNLYVNIATHKCHMNGGNQAYVFTTDGNFLKDSIRCVGTDIDTGRVHLVYCYGAISNITSMGDGNTM